MTQLTASLSAIV